MRRGSLYLCVGNEEGGPCICVWGIRKGIPVYVGNEKGGPCICVWGIRKGIPVSGE